MGYMNQSVKRRYGRNGRSLLKSAAVISAALAGLRTAHAAQTLYWDPSASGNGTWDNGLTLGEWSTGQTAAAPNTYWLGGAQAYFANANVSAGTPYTATISGTVDADSLVFGSAASVNVSGGTLFLTGTNSLTVNAGAGPVTIATAVNLSQFTNNVAASVNNPAVQAQSWVNNTANAVTVSGSINFGVVNFAGGTFNVTGTSDDSTLGMNVSAGTLILGKLAGSSAHSVGSNAGLIALTVGAGATAQLGNGGNGDQIYQNSSVLVNGTFDLNGQSEGFDGLTGAGLITNTAVGTTGTLTFGQASFNGTYTNFSGRIQNGSGTTAITKVGTAIQYLTGSSNTYTGGTNVSAGRLSAAGGSLGTGAVSVVSGATLILSNGGTFSNALSLGGTGQATQGNTYEIAAGQRVAGALNVNGNATLSGPVSLTSTTAVTIARGTTTTMSGNISEATTGSGLSLYGGGTLQLNGTATYTGATTLIDGALSLGSGASINPTSMLTLGGGQLVVAGTQSFGVGSTTNNGSVAAGASTVISNGSVGLGLLAVAMGGTIDFQGTGTTSTSTPNVADGFILGWATVNGGADFATSFGDGSTAANVVAYSSVADFHGYTKASSAGTSASSYASTMIDVDTDVAPDGPINPEALRFSTARASTLTLAAGTNTVNAGAILVTPTVGSNVTTLTGGTITGAPITSSAQSTGVAELVVHQYNADATAAGALAISAVITNYADQGGNAFATGLTKSGPGMLILSGTSNTYTGPTTIGAGTLVVGTGTAGQNGSINLSSGITNNGALVFNTAGNVTYTRAISGTGSITMGGPGVTTLGTVVLGAPGQDIGPLVVNAGTLSLNSGTDQYNSPFPFSTVTVNNGGTLRLDSNNQFGWGNDVIYRPMLTVNGGTVIFGTSGDQRIGPVVMTGGSMTSALTGGVLYFVANPNSNGTESVTTNAAATTATITYPSASFSNSTVLNVASGTTPSGIDLAINGNIGGGAASTVTKTGAGTLQLNGSNTFSGPTSVLGGSLLLSNGGALGSALVMTGGTGLVFDKAVTSNAFTIGALAGAGNLVLANNAASPAAVALSIGSNTNYVTYTGVLSGAGSLVKTGSGAETLTGNSTYAGPTTIANGTIQLGNGGTTGSLGTGTINFNASNTVLRISRSDSPVIANAIALNSGNDFITVDSGDTATFTGNVTGGGQLWKNGTGTLVLAGSNNYSGGTVLSGGVLAFSSAANLGTGPLYLRNTSATFSPTDYNGGEVLRYTGAGATTISNTGSQYFFQLSQFAIDVSSATGNLTLSSPILSGTVTGASGFGFVKTGPGTLTMGSTTNSTYGGATNIAAGAVRANTVLASTGSVVVASGATLGGNGSVGSVIVNGTITAGPTNAATGVLTTKAESWNTGGNYLAKVVNTNGATDGTASDVLSLSSLTLASGFTVTLSPQGTVSFNASNGVQTTVGAATAPVSGSYIVLARDSSGGASQFNSSAAIASLTLSSGAITTFAPNDTIVLSSYFDGSNYNLIAEDVAAAPEPASTVLLGATVAPLLLGRRRRRSSAGPSW